MFPTPVLLLAAPFLQEPAAPDAADFSAWAGEHAVQLTSLDPHADRSRDFSFLDEALAGKRVVFIGETDHFVAERMECRLILLRELAKRGYRRIGMEMGWSDALRMDAYLRTGDEAWLDRVALYGYRGDLRTDRSDEVPGWTDDPSAELMGPVTEEARWFLTELRAIGTGLEPGGERLSWFGYDSSFRPGGGYADAGAILAPHADDPAVADVLRRMERVQGESRIEEAERLEALVAVLDEQADELAPLFGEGLGDARRSLQRMADGFRFIDGLQAVEDTEARLAALAAREERMCRNLDELLAEWPPDEKLVLLGHALHLSKDSERIRPPGYAMWRSIGTHVANELPGEVWGVWLLHGRGRHGVPRADPPIRSYRSPADSVERRLADVGPILLLPLGSDDPREAWLREERVVSFGGSPGRAILPRQADCLFFVERTREPGKRR
jgi:erythromycin esterase-like protein